MSKGLDALKKLGGNYVERESFGMDCSVYVEDFDEYDIVKKELEAFEIVKKKSVNLGLVKMVAFMKKKGADGYNAYFSTKEMHLTDKEFDLLKEVLQ